VQNNKFVWLGISNQATAKLNAENKNATQRRGVFDPGIREGTMLSLPFCSGLPIPVFYTRALLECDPACISAFCDQRSAISDQQI
jgi:hypothetical protein